MRKVVFLLLLSVNLHATPEWFTNASDAFRKAKAEHKCVLLNFSGSDWCGPCIRMHKEIFGSDVFVNTVSANMVLLNADFPRQRKNKLPAELQKQNDQLADKYNPQGLFPFTLLLDENGTVLASWDGFPKNGVDKFSEEILRISKKHS